MIGGGSACLRLLRWEQRTKLLPMGVSECGQARQADRLWNLWLSQRRLTGAALHMAAPGPCLMHASEARPPYPLDALLLWLPECMDDPAQFGHTQLDTGLVGPAFFSCA
jgi:hypothetical protein